MNPCSLDSESSFLVILKILKKKKKIGDLKLKNEFPAGVKLLGL